MGTEFINPPTAFNSLPRGYSHVVKVTNPRAFYFVAGAAAVDTGLQLQHPGDVEGQTRLIFQNIARDLEASGASLADIVDMTVYLADVSDQWRVRGVRNEFFPAGPASVLHHDRRQRILHRRHADRGRRDRRHLLAVPQTPMISWNAVPLRGTNVGRAESCD